MRKTPKGCNIFPHGRTETAAFRVSCVLLGLLVVLGILADESHAKRPFFEYKGDYRENIKKQTREFKDAYGYELMALDVDWRPEQIALMDEAFSQLPAGFYRLRGLKGFYRTGYLRAGLANVPKDEVPAATFPAFSTIYRGATNSWQVEIEDDYLRVEFFNPLFNEDQQDIINIIQHEMAHAYDMANGMISFSAEWLEISHFRLANLPPLDARKGGDFLFTLLNNPSVEHYAPVSTRHHPHYSRQNPQEDFANSVAGYIHYPYFQYTNPRRYQFLKAKVFGGKEFFPSTGDAKTYEQAALADLDKALKEKNWRKAGKVMVEMSRTYYPPLDEKIVSRLRTAVEADNAHELGLASCFLIHPDAIKFRRELVRKKQVELRTFLQNKRCAQVGRDWFEKVLAKLPAANIFYYREKGRDVIQFLDPALQVAFARGFETEYRWKLGFDGKEPFAKGQARVEGGGHGSVKIDLGKSLGRKLTVPFGEELLLDIDIRRNHPKNFKILNSTSARIRFVAQPWFDYEGPSPPDIKVVYPLSLLFLGKEKPSP